jgi:hypothetical protein
LRHAFALALLAVIFSGCETNAERSAKLAKLVHHNAPAQAGLKITRASSQVKVISTAVLHDENGAAAVVTLRNLSATALRDVPIAITVSGAQGASLYSNSAPGLAPSLVSASLLPAHRELTWIDDQVQAGQTPVRVSATVGQAPAAAGPLPQLTIEGGRLFEEGSSGLGIEGTVVNRSAVTQQELVVYALARRGGRIVAAGRAVLPQAIAGASTPFQIFPIGDPRGATLSFSAPPSTLG